jgi:hypothetical protein
MVMTKSSSLTQVSNFIAKVNGEKPNTVRQRHKEWYQEAEAKTGKKRSSLDVSSCFAPLMRWVISLLPRNIEQIALALDATSISDKFVVLSLNIMLAGCGIPLAWCVVKASEPGSWKPHWQKLIEKLQGAIPCHFQVIVTADRGLYASWLYQLIVEAGWHPFLRINHQGTYRIPPDKTWRSLAEVAVATLWMVILGGDAENSSPPPHLQQLPSQHLAFSSPRPRNRLRQLSCFLQGLLTLTAHLLNNIPIYLHRWSSFPPTPVDAFYCPNSS